MAKEPARIESDGSAPVDALREEIAHGRMTVCKDCPVRRQAALAGLSEAKLVALDEMLDLNKPVRRRVAAGN